MQFVFQHLGTQLITKHPAFLRPSLRNYSRTHKSQFCIKTLIYFLWGMKMMEIVNVRSLFPTELLLEQNLFGSTDTVNG